MRPKNFPKLRAKIVEHGYTTIAFAEAIGVCIDSAYRKLRKESDFTLTEVYLILKLFDCKFEEIFTEEDFNYVKEKRNNSENQPDERKTAG